MKHEKPVQLDGLFALLSLKSVRLLILMDREFVNLNS
ncbi:hypothetical protein Pan54_29910 [Rubinisphaera italica]|uniref:Uncharacterized protein n=1 Tax=Rubinisphaera italica TaxID=2527969 RepID=A0A5C5XGZ0_9PLAN|nr:hypothetical protein Pan54_29910 [Rubinisphaera italica]